MGHMMMNFSANMLGLDNAATPFGIKAMESLQELNPDKSRATNAQVMFMCLHAAGLTLIPVAIIAARAAVKPPSANPTDIFVPCMIATFVATMAAMLMVSFKQKINIFQPVILAWVGGISVIIAALVWYLTSLSSDRLQLVSGILGNGILLLILFLIVLGVTGSDAKRKMIVSMNAYSADSFAGRLACVLQGSSDTTFYVIAVYFGAISVKNTRYSVGVMLLADLVGIITSILLAYMFFG
jgi:hypothetical protein